MDKEELKSVIEKLLQAIEKDSEPTLDMFAAHAMQGLLVYNTSPYETIPKESYEIAFEMMEERKKWMHE